jgi:hypothetical protein
MHSECSHRSFRFANGNKLLQILSFYQEQHACFFAETFNLDFRNLWIFGFLSLDKFFYGGVVKFALSPLLVPLGKLGERRFGDQNILGSEPGNSVQEAVSRQIGDNFRLLFSREVFKPGISSGKFGFSVHR